MTELRTPPRRPPPPDFAEEEEVELGRLWRPLAARWWLLVAGLVAGVVLGYLVSLGGGQVWQATAVIYLGTPLSVSGSSAVQGLQQNPRTVNEIVHAQNALDFAAARCGLRRGDVGGVSTKTVSGTGKTATRTGGGQLVQITVQGGGPRKSACPANVLAGRVVGRISGYADTKIATFKSSLVAVDAAIASVDRRIAVLNRSVSKASGGTFEDLFLVSQLDSALQRRTQLVDQQTSTQQLLALAEDIEKPQVVERAAARKTTARSSRNAMIVGGLLGLLVGGFLALVWDRLPLPAPARDA